jgi:ketosteroid isomerase-like protein
MKAATKPPHHPSPSNLEVARRYLEVLGDPASTPAQLEALLAPDVTVEELPSLIAPRGRTRDRPAMLQGFAAGKTLLASQDYTVVNALECRETVVLEVRWRGVLAQAFGKLAPGTELRARFAMFLELRDGTIAAQRNYDCYEPIGS